jgi:DNA-directed RNA polymerase specialized sigma24 family protein
MTTSLDEEFTPDTDGGSARCMFCDTVVDVPEGPEPPGWPVFDGWTVCDDCSEKLEKEAPVIADGIDRLLSILTSVEREVLMLHYAWDRYDRKHYSFDEIGERLGITPQRVAEIEEQALEKTRSFAQKHNHDDRL